MAMKLFLRGLFFCISMEEGMYEDLYRERLFDAFDIGFFRLGPRSLELLDKGRVIVRVNCERDGGAGGIKLISPSGEKYTQLSVQQQFEATVRVMLKYKTMRKKGGIIR